VIRHAATRAIRALPIPVIETTLGTPLVASSSPAALRAACDATTGV
jgi:hypothetical protein